MAPPVRRHLKRAPGPRNADGCPFCGADLAARVVVQKGDQQTLVIKCPSDGELVLLPDLVAALPTLSDERRDAVHTWLCNLRIATDTTETLSLAKVEHV